LRRDPIERPDRIFSRLVDDYLTTRHNSGGLVGNAHSYIFPAQELMDFTLPVMASVAAGTRNGD
jgi:hypothetical protein